MELHTWLTNTTFLNLPMRNWALALASSVLVYLLSITLLRIAQKRLRTQAAAQTDQAGLAAVRPMLAHVLAHTSALLLAIASLLVGAHVLDLPERWTNRLSQAWYVIVALQIALWGAQIIKLMMQRHMLRDAAPDAPGAPQASVSTTLIGWALNTVLWSVVALAVLSNLGFNITAFVASMGIGGIAVALAAQNVLGDLFASIAIALDKPFEVGDAVNNGSFVGTVERVGMKTTRVRSLSGEEIAISNTEMLNGVMRNYKRMQKRRIEFKFGVTYDTTPEQAAAIPEVVRRVAEALPDLVFDRAHLNAFGDSSLDYVVVYTMQVPDYGRYMDHQQAIMIGLMREFATMGVSFAFPTRTLIMTPAASPGRMDAPPLSV